MDVFGVEILRLQNNFLRRVIGFGNNGSNGDIKQSITQLTGFTNKHSK